MTILEEKLGYHFKDQSLLVLALTHKSFENESPGKGAHHNERLEFLGDAVLGLALSELLMNRAPQLSEGDLSKLRASLVNEAVLSEVARQLELDKKLRLGKGEILTGGARKPRLLASAFEAVLGAVFLESGYEASREIVRRIFAVWLDSLDDVTAPFANDYKTRLQELSQERFRKVPIYRVCSEEGPDHEKIFHVEVRIQDQVVGTGQGRSKKQAEQEAARQALEGLQ